MRLPCTVLSIGRRFRALGNGACAASAAWRHSLRFDPWRTRHGDHARDQRHGCCNVFGAFSTGALWVDDASRKLQEIDAACESRYGAAKFFHQVSCENTFNVSAGGTDDGETNETKMRTKGRSWERCSPPPPGSVRKRAMMITETLMRFCAGWPVVQDRGRAFISKIAATYSDAEAAKETVDAASLCDGTCTMIAIWRPSDRLCQRYSPEGQPMVPIQIRCDLRLLWRVSRCAERLVRGAACCDVHEAPMPSSGRLRRALAPVPGSTASRWRCWRDRGWSDSFTRIPGLSKDFPPTMRFCGAHAAMGSLAVKAVHAQVNSNARSAWSRSKLIEIICGEELFES